MSDEPNEYDDKDDEQPEPTPQQQPDQQETQPEPPPEESYYKLPPAMAEAGGVGVVGLVSGMYTVSNGSYLVSPGTPMLMSAEDAQTLIDQGVVVSLDSYPLPT